MASLRINRSIPDGIPQWERLLQRVLNPHRTVTITIVGKYVKMLDSYLSLQKAILHASTACRTKVNINWVESGHLDEDAALEDPEEYKDGWTKIRASDAILVPGGFGNRGHVGKMAACNYARTNNVPFLGICLGFQMAVCDFARSVLGIQDASSEEFEPEADNKVIMFMPEVSKTHMGGTMRLGLRETDIPDKKSQAYKVYGSTTIAERHRHRYEVNPDFVPRIEEAGLKFTGRSDVRMEIFELPGHPFFMGAQYHPEYLSRPMTPSPIFVGWIKAAIAQASKNAAQEKTQEKEQQKEQQKEVPTANAPV